MLILNLITFFVRLGSVGFVSLSSYLLQRDLSTIDVESQVLPKNMQNLSEDAREWIVSMQVLIIAVIYTFDLCVNYSLNALELAHRFQGIKTGMKRIVRRVGVTSNKNKSHVIEMYDTYENRILCKKHEDVSMWEKYDAEISPDVNSDIEVDFNSNDHKIPDKVYELEMVLDKNIDKNTEKNTEKNIDKNLDKNIEKNLEKPSDRLSDIFEEEFSQIGSIDSEKSISTNLQIYVQKIHAIGLLIWLSLYYTDFYNIETTLSFTLGLSLAWMLGVSTQNNFSQNIINHLYIILILISIFLMFFCLGYNNFNRNETDLQYTDKDVFVYKILQYYLFPFATGIFSMQDKHNENLMRDSKIATTTCILLCLPALLRINISIVLLELASYTTLQHFNLFLVQPFLKLLLMYVIIQGICRKRTLEIIISFIFFIALVIYQKNVFLLFDISNIILISSSVLVFIHLLCIVVEICNDNSL